MFARSVESPYTAIVIETTEDERLQHTLTTR